ncbi:MAG: amidohydrolase family protein [Lachnospiraceae bacterium]|nr:amidohydrolase family protein [Lachnospiraceae bacterium]
MYGECHAHIIMDGKNYKQAVSLHKNGVQDFVIHEHFKCYQKAGISFVRDGGDALGVSARAKELAADYGIDYRTPVFAIHKNGYYGGIVGKGFDTIEEYAALTAEVSKRHGDFIKIMASGILDFDEFGKVSTPLQDPELICKMVSIAHEEGFAVMVHVNTPTQIRYALEAGCDSIEHGYYMDDTCRRLFTQTGAVWVPTLATCASLRGCGRFSEEAVARITRCHMENVRLALLQNVPIAPGSDAGAYLVPHAAGTCDEIRYLKEACQGDPLLLSKLQETLTKSQKLIEEKFCRP